MSDPWDRNAGKFDRPSSGVPQIELRKFEMRSNSTLTHRTLSPETRERIKRDGITVSGVVTGFVIDKPKPPRRTRKTRTEPI